MNGHVFVSYAHEDWDRVRVVSERLQAMGWTVWVAPHKLRGAAEWAGEIHTAVRTCRVFLLLMSPSAMHSGYVLKELHVAVDAARPVVAALIEHVQLTPAFEYLIAGRQVVDATDMADWQLDDLVHAVGSVEQQKEPRQIGRRVARVLGGLLAGVGIIVVLAAMGLFLLRMQQFISSSSPRAGERMLEPFLLFFVGMVVAVVGQGMLRLAGRR